MLLDLMELSGITLSSIIFRILNCSFYSTIRDCSISHEAYAVLVVSFFFIISFWFSLLPPIAAVLLSEVGLIVVKVVQSSWLSESSSFVEAFEGHVLWGPCQSHD